MAVTKVKAIRHSLEKTIAYAANEKKTALEGVIEYAADPDKTEQHIYETAINCKSVETAYDEMLDTKRRFGKEGKVLAYHYIQSFNEGEVTPELAHRIGVEFARECFGDRFEVVIGTHLNTDNLHNHIIVNSVSFTDGGKFRSTPKSYFKIIQKVSDRLCREHQLDVIDNPKGKGMHYAEWKAMNEGKPTIRGMIRDDIDDIISVSKSYIHFWELMRKNGYSVKRGPNVKHTAIKPPFSERYMRLRSLGEQYTEDSIRERVMAARNGIKPLTPKKQYNWDKVDVRKYKRTKLKGFKALYFHYLYLFKKIRKKQTPKKVSAFMREEIVKFERYKAQFQFLYDNNIENTAQLSAHRAVCEGRITELTRERRSLYKERDDADEKDKEEITKKISSVNDELKGLRQAVRMCQEIHEDAERIQERQEQAKNISKNERIKEAKAHERKWRSR